MLGAVLFANFHGPGGRIYSSFITCGLTGMCTWVSFWLQSARCNFLDEEDAFSCRLRVHPEDYRGGLDIYVAGDLLRCYMWTWMIAPLGLFAGHLEPMVTFAKDHALLMRILHLSTKFLRAQNPTSRHHTVSSTQH